MAFLEDKIDEIRDPHLRQTILQEIKKLKSEKKFGLVFEEHIPELAPIYNAPIRPGDEIMVESLLRIGLRRRDDRSSTIL